MHGAIAEPVEGQNTYIYICILSVHGSTSSPRTVELQIRCRSHFSGSKVMEYLYSQNVAGIFGILLNKLPFDVLAV